MSSKVPVRKETVRNIEILYCEGGKALEQVAQKSYGCPFLAVFKARLDGALSNPVQRKVSPPMTGEWI